MAYDIFRKRQVEGNWTIGSSDLTPSPSPKLRKGLLAGLITLGAAGVALILTSKGRTVKGVTPSRSVYRPDPRNRTIFGTVDKSGRIMIGPMGGR